MSSLRFLKQSHLLRKMQRLVWSVALFGVLVTMIGLAIGIANHHWLGFGVGLSILTLVF